MKCWRCGREIAQGSSACEHCGASQARSAATSEVGRALRQVCDRWGCREALSDSAHILAGLDGLTTDGAKTRNLFRMALDMGVGEMYVEQLQRAAGPDEVFDRRVHARLADAGLSDAAAVRLVGWLDEMIGWRRAGTSSSPKPTAASVSTEAMGAKRGGDSTIIGIDLGTMFSRAAVMVDARPVIVPTPEGGRGRPSAVGAKDGALLVGKEALRPGVTRPNAPFMAWMGNPIVLALDGASHLPQFYAALLLRRLRRDAELYLGHEVRGAVVTVPNAFTIAQRAAVLEAGRIAGLKIHRLINASSAAALAQGWRDKREQAVLVCNLGARTFDVSVLRLENGVAEVVAIGGDCDVGGDHFDSRVVDWLAQEFRNSSGIDLRADEVAMARLREAARRAKEELSTNASTHVQVPYIASGRQGAVHLDLTLNRARFDELTAPLIDRASERIRRALRESADCGESSVDHVDKVLLVGGASRIPAFRSMVMRLAGQTDLLGVQPDECAALGAALQAGVLEGNLSDLVLLEATALPLGIETAGGAFTPIISRNATVPVVRKQEFATSADNQTSMVLHVLQGERELAKDDVSLGRFEFSGIPPAKKGVARIVVSFDLDANGMAKLKAVDSGTGRQWDADLAANFRLSEERVRYEAHRAAEWVP